MGKSGRKRGIYYKRIIILMLIFMGCVVCPFTVILFRVSEKNVLNRINESNEHVLNQMKYTYDFISDNISALTLSVFSQNDVAEIMYSGEPKWDDIYSTMKNLEDTVIQAQTSLQSIAVYNADTGNWYSTDADGNETNEMKSFLERNGNVPKLKPILRKISVGSQQPEEYSYVFSYFMYAYANPSQRTSSFIVVNQTVDEFVNNLNVGLGDVSGTYIVNSGGEVYGGRTKNPIYEEIVQKCIAERVKQEPENFYVEKVDGQKYLVSYICLDETMNTLVMIQNYRDIFQGMQDLKNEFIFFCLVYAGIAAAAIIFMTKRIYTPINELVNYVAEVSGRLQKEEVEEAVDEIGHLRNVFHKASTLNQRLKEERNDSRSIITNYWRRSLLTDSSEERVELFYKNMPDSILSRRRAYLLEVVCFHLDSYEENKFAFEEGDRQLLLDSAGNVFLEMLGEEYESESVYMMDGNMALILNKIPEEVQRPQMDETLELALEERIATDIRRCVESMQDFMTEHFGVTVSVSCAGTDDSLTGLAELYSRAKTYGSYRLIYGKGSFLGKKECQNNINNRELSYSRDLQKKLEEQLKLGNTEMSFQVLDEIQKSISKLSYDNIIVSSMSLATKINIVISEMNLMRRRTNDTRIEYLYNAVLKMEFLDDFFSELKGRINGNLEGSELFVEKENDREELFLDMVIQFVQKNYTDFNLSSQSIAEYINMSSRYVMKKFKKCTGITLNEYILTVRMKQAAYFLKNTDMSVGQVSENIGIENENYFYRLFKKVYGCTPREFAAGQQDQNV